jgi:hypothetical protein
MNEKQKESKDFEINNYSLDEIFKLFHFTTNEQLTETKMKEAKKKVLKLHPDKSNIDIQIYLFYVEAYKILYSLFEFQNKYTKKNKNENYDNDVYSKEDEKAILNQFFNANPHLKQNSYEFQSWFNDKFEKYNQQNKIGYGDWLKQSSSSNPCENMKTTKDSFHQDFKKMKNNYSVVVYKDFEPVYLGSSYGTSLVENNSNFSNEKIFTSGFGYTDLRQAYEESVINVNENDFHNMKKYKNVNEYETERKSQSFSIMNEKESHDYFSRLNKKEEIKSMEIAYQLAKQVEESQKKQSMFWGELKLLT